MKNRINILTILCCIGLFGSCNKSDLASGNSAASGVVTIQFNTPSATDTKTEEPGTLEENYIGMTQVIFFAPTNDKSGVVERIILFNAAESNKSEGQYTWDPETKKLSVNGVNINKNKGVCVVSNATADNGYDTKLIKVGETTEADLLKAITKSAPLLGQLPKEKSILMSYIISNHDFIANHTLTVPLTRQLVKINLTVKLDQIFAGLFPNTSFLDTELEGNTFVNIYNIQDQSFVYSTEPASAPTTSNLLDFKSVKVTKSGTDAATTQWNLTIYTYENPQMGKSPENKSASTWFVLNLPYENKNSSEVFANNYYKFYINNTLDPENPHKTERNNIYDLTVTVNGFGSLTPDDGRFIDVTTTVLDWNTLTMDDDVGDWVMKLNNTSVTLNGNVEDNSLIASVSTTLNESLLTDLFSEITYPAGMDKDQKKLKLEYVRNGDGKSITIKIKDTAVNPYKGDGIATFYIQYGVYNKKITVNYPPTNVIGYFGGDPIKDPGTNGYMYSSRLAVALLDSEKAMQYIDHTEYTSTIPIPNSIYYGKNMNVAAATTSNRVHYIAFNHCASLNDDVDGDGEISYGEMVWYLPSQNQLMAMYVFKDGMETPLTDKEYWSATEVDRGSAWFIKYGIGFLTSDGKMFREYYVRCVRDI